MHTSPARGSGACTEFYAVLRIRDMLIRIRIRAFNMLNVGRFSSYFFSQEKISSTFAASHRETQPSLFLKEPYQLQHFVID